jgi:magnesium and cobalt transporter
VADKLITLAVGKERSRGNIVTQDMVRTLAQEAVGDGVLGILYARDLLATDLGEAQEDPDWLQSQLREPFLVPESKPIVELFRTFRKRRLSLALTVDEYGGVTGLVSIEDLLECIFGELPSASEARFSGELSQRVEDAENLQASMSVDQFNTGLDAKLPTDVADTLGGLILHEYGEMPAEGAKVVCHGWELMVISVQRNRIQEVRAKKLDKGQKKRSGAPDKSSGGTGKPTREG